MQAVLPGCIKRGTKIISNQGWINPDGAAQRVTHWLRELGAHGVKVAAVSGSVITDRVLDLTDTILENGKPTSTLKDSLVSAEAYLGAEPIVEALRQGAQIVITGRVADPSLFMAPMMHEFGWDPADHVRLGRGIGLGHLMECGSQVTGGYFPDPGFKDMPEPWNLGFPIIEVEEDGSAVITKLPGTGGAVNLMTVNETYFFREAYQFDWSLERPGPEDGATGRMELSAGRGNSIALEAANPRYETRIFGPDRVRVTGIGGKPRTPTLKVSIGCMEGFIGEDMFFYAGPGALRRAKLAKQILEERFKIVRLDAEDLRIDFLGLNAIHGAPDAAPAAGHRRDR